MPHIVLNSPQENRVRTVLWSLDRNCAELEQLLDAAGAPGLVQVYNDLTADEKRTLRAKIAAIRRQIAELAVQLQLSPHVIDVRRHTRAVLSLDWSALVDTLPGKLRRYGDVDADTAAFLQPVLETLIASLDDALQVQPGDRNNKR